MARLFLPLTLSLTLLLTSCRAESPTPIQVPERTGSASSLLIGLKLDSARGPNAEGVLPVESSPSFTVRVRGDVGEAADEQKLSVSALLDFRHPVTLEGKRRQDMLIDDGGSVEASWHLDVVALPPGRHCLLIFVSGDAKKAIETSGAYNSVSSLYELQVGQGPDYCDGARAMPEDVHEDVFDAYHSCGYPVISASKEEPFLRRHASTDDPRWLITPRCSSQVKIAFVRDGVLQGASDKQQPISAPSYREDQKGWVFALGTLQSGAWTCAVVQRQHDRSSGQDQEASNTATCEPVLVR